MLVMMRGVPGSGKSTHAKSLSPIRICSADHFFINSEGEYVFNPSELPKAHAQCLAQAEEALALYDDQYVIVVDNTNIKLDHMRAYEDAATKHGHQIRYYYVQADPDVAYARCTHGVPLHVIKRMASEYEKHPKDSSFI